MTPRRILQVLLLVALFAGAPLSGAHPDGVGGPKPSCEAALDDLSVHEYGAPSTGFLLLLEGDFSVPPCDHDDGSWDGHYEFAHGGARLLASEPGAAACFGTYADHVPGGIIRVEDAVLAMAGADVVFSVYADTQNNDPFPREPDCGDFESDYGVDCVNQCAPGFPPGLDGSYVVYVQGTTGHVVSEAARPWPIVKMPCRGKVSTDPFEQPVLGGFIGLAEGVEESVPTRVPWPWKARWDYGDAPDHLIGSTMPAYLTPANTLREGHFATREASAHAYGGQPAARHRVTTVAWLGAKASLETGAASGFDQDGVTNLVGTTADHDKWDDGLLPATLAPGATAPIQFSVTSMVGVTNWYVNALVDWNFDGWWYTPSGGAPEWAIQNMPITVPPMTSSLFTVPVTAGTAQGTPWVRLTLTEKPILAQSGDPNFQGGEWNGAVPINTYDHNGAKAFPCGETEDRCGILRVTHAVPSASDALGPIVRATRCAPPPLQGEPEPDHPAQA